MPCRIVNKNFEAIVFVGQIHVGTATFAANLMTIGLLRHVVKVSIGATWQIQCHNTYSKQHTSYAITTPDHDISKNYF